ncbi:hypothetical protein ACIOD2_13485 [Amycolatopsis sp. NPDC088138]|uniref:hypothetical protein n=1 Tax=Amycolatopsis sp. NPDC088138 TaxID=3363938 RepID=UPI0037FF8581
MTPHRTTMVLLRASRIAHLREASGTALERSRLMTPRWTPRKAVALLLLVTGLPRLFAFVPGAALECGGAMNPQWTQRTTAALLLLGNGLLGATLLPVSSAARRWNAVAQ